MKKVLVADDSAMSRMIVLRCLEMAGLKPEEAIQAGNGKEALELALALGPDLIIADLNMPVMGGEDLLAAVKAEPRLKDTPVLIVSSALNPDRAARLLSMGAMGTLLKPVSPPGIRRALAARFGKEGG